ncbi:MULTISPECIES: hypothetical protein [Brevibacillus]|uniref:Uncharacterized protein n=1 Tax=Brevibacillus borstelensis AK1 TaxID=1300222 RepID=M8D9P1_9BACL|nr:hypothetical protein [Brevibacillus borstelensis]EMT50078.1 hypothetical protein I532_24477 [Brevibacillus borstelensis AK1]MBE5394852.1 hypothetical protein [Brevibacillus borstelensis]MCC0566493.1 hypothetical protein [Brevibacillus borstelensis]MCM3472863.1 hypothetical protein [Brevibacillus borstelensis]MCM3561545.1 hypothetical protein [Brevibacillus borstelensis]
MFPIDTHREDHLPDFKQLTDRVIAPPPQGPIIGIRTNLDKESEDAGKEAPK